ncbi:hypothetical protein [Tsukamurella sp. PLM1]|uniref:hypothetical protein n=1 Tax=Tsukamurella sp. PLM1 TaxID=2929795 RepID=UPI0020632B39|nr:hypothetical protein [Tsukamurella sp. PLM1]BDH58787.1 hypothetical protein MTP03_37260 [Tsukamurella sp. PLM1]
MSEYREHWNLTADPPTAAVYARLADLHDESRRRTVELRSRRLRPGLARALRRLASAIEPTPTTPTCPDVT